MKRLDELTDVELVGMTGEEIEMLIDLECAHESVPLLPVLPVKPAKQDFKKDFTIYQIGNFNFIRQTEALRVLETLQKYDLVGTTGWGDTERVMELSEYNKPKIDTKNIYSEETYDRIEKEIVSYKVLFDEYDKAKLEYDKVYRERKEIEDEVYDRIKEIETKDAKIKKLYNTFDRYLKLAEGDKFIALKFLNNAQPEALDYPEIQELGNTL